MAATITYVFTSHSPWTYLGHAAFLDIARRHGAAVEYRPVPLGAIFAETGGQPLAKRHPVRQHYRLVELQRWRARRGLTLNLHPQFFPVDPALADHLAIAIVDAGGDPDPFLRRVFAAVWAEERNLADPATIADLAAASGIGPELQARAGAPEIEAAYQRNREMAEAAGVFGAPSYILNGELFWGQDRLDLLDDALATGRPPYTA
jgi:2-hydroxychromene-2-carboxylate isomerase